MEVPFRETYGYDPVPFLPVLSGRAVRSDPAAGGRGAGGGGPIAGERVILRSIEGAVLATARTGPDGGFRVPFLPPGVYALAIGEPNVRIVSLRDGQRLDLGTVELFAGGY